MFHKVLTITRGLKRIVGILATASALAMNKARKEQLDHLVTQNETDLNTLPLTPLISLGANARKGLTGFATTANKDYADMHTDSANMVGEYVNRVVIECHHHVVVKPTKSLCASAKPIPDTVSRDHTPEGAVRGIIEREGCCEKHIEATRAISRHELGLTKKCTERGHT